MLGAEKKEEKKDINKRRKLCGIDPRKKRKDSSKNERAEIVGGINCQGCHLHFLRHLQVFMQLLCSNPDLKNV